MFSIAMDDLGLKETALRASEDPPHPPNFGFSLVATCPD